MKLRIEDDQQCQIIVLRVPAETQMLAGGHRAVARKFVEIVFDPPTTPMEEFRLVLAGLQGKVYLIAVGNTHC